MGNFTNESHNFIKMNNGSADLVPMLIKSDEENFEEGPNFNFSNRDLEKIRHGRNVLQRSEQVISLD